MPASDEVGSRPALSTNGGGFGSSLRRYRLRSGHSQNSLAKAVGINASYINRMETGERDTPTRQVVAALVRTLGLAPDEADRLLIVAGYATSWAADRTVRQVAMLLAGDAVLATALRCQIDALARMAGAGRGEA
jgi:transcriptional regulator with XRE-family HTH domain